jgi:hypothetical protein
MLAASRRLGARALPRVALQQGMMASSRMVVGVPAQRDGVAPSKAASMKMGELGKDKMEGLPAVQGVEFVLTGMDRLANWARKSSMWPMTFGLA